jgi:hypothetical protein
MIFPVMETVHSFMKLITFSILNPFQGYVMLHSLEML